MNYAESVRQLEPRVASTLGRQNLQDIYNSEGVRESLLDRVSEHFQCWLFLGFCIHPRVEATLGSN
jgi:hypothetical protein